ncbi:hypothetical protein GCM10009611_05640 [Arthrobacter roseus]
MAEVGLFSESVEVVCAPSGRPLELQWRGHSYQMAAEPLRWYERRNWWAEETRAEIGRGAGLVDHEIWRVQARINKASQILTLDISRQINTGNWRIIRIHDAIRDLSA